MAVDKIKGYKAEDRITFVNIDTIRAPLPPFVTRVPMLIVNPRERYMDEQLFQYIETFKPREIGAFDAGCSQSWLNENLNNAPSGAYEWVGHGAEVSDLAAMTNRPQQPQDDRRSMRGAQVDAEYQTLLAQREMEVTTNNKPSEAELAVMKARLFPQEDM
jgi:hypothetical protein